MNVPTAMIVTAASRVAVNLIAEALGNGPGVFGVRLTTDPAAKDYDADVLGTFPGVPTHYGTMYAVLEKPFADRWLDISNGILPTELPGGREWGVGGVISYADALAAVTPTGKLKCYLGSDSVPAYDMFWGAVGGWRDPVDDTLRLRKFPDPIFS